MSSRPAYTSLKSQQPQATVKKLRDRIRNGSYTIGQWLPTERDLMQELKVQRRVVRTAVAQLEQEGLLSRRPNCRPIVQAAPSQETSGSPYQVDASRLVALIMYHGGALERVDSAQQRIFWGMNVALAGAGYHAIFLDLGANVGTAQANAAVEASHLRYVMEHGFGGAVFYAYAYNMNRELIHEVSRALPLILIDRTVPGIDADYVGVENRQAMFDATKYLVGLGHKRIAYVTTYEPINTVLDRLKGYLGALQDEVDDDVYERVLLIPFVGKPWPVFDTLFSRPAEERPTAVVCVNDYEAVRVHERLQLLNLKVPDDVSIIGCDNIVQELSPGLGLTTIAQPFEAIGEEAVRLFLRRKQIFDPPLSHVELPSKLIIRQSTTAAISD
jgi:DNA-binding LacI/PurR family transcriptional regulator